MVPMPVPPRNIEREQPNHEYAINQEYIEGLRARQRIINDYFAAWRKGISENTLNTWPSIILVNRCANRL